MDNEFLFFLPAEPPGDKSSPAPTAGGVGVGEGGGGEGGSQGMDTGAGKTPPPQPELSPEIAAMFAEQRRKFREEQLAEEARRYIFLKK
jgi:hypothetical protein